MKRYLIVFVAVLVAMVALVFVAKTIEGDRGADAARDPDGTVVAGGRLAKSDRAKRGRAGRAAVTPSEAAKRLRALLRAGVEGAPKFEEIDALARRLSDEDLRELIELTGLAKMQALVPWVRCALYAEWGRRDAEGAMAYLRDPETENATEGWSARQAWFSLFRGWSDRDPEAALAMLRSADFRAWHEDPDRASGTAMRWDQYWQDPAFEAVFRELVRREGAVAWEKIPSVGFTRFAALRGIFWGAEDQDERLAWVTLWGPEWTTAAGSGNQGNYGQMRALGLSAAASLAEFDLQVAKDWLGTLESAAAIAEDRFQLTLVEWASRHPQRAEKRLAAAAQSEAASLVRGILLIDVTRAPEVIARIEDASQRFQVLETAIEIPGQRISDFFPGLGQLTRLREQPGRRAALEAAIEAGNFSAGQRAELQEKLRESSAAE